MNINNNLMVLDQTTDNFQFSAIDVDRLGASEYTLVTLVLDMSSSVRSFKKELTDAISMVLETCKMSPHSENLMFRLVSFSNSVVEEHGFLPLSSLDIDSYNNVVSPKGMTALYDGVLNSISATSQYGNTLYKEDFETNAIIFIITDGDDNQSRHGVTDVKNALSNFDLVESVESIRTVLIGVNTEQDYIKKYLESFKIEVNIDEYIDITKATSQSLAKMSAFISKSISAQSQALGTGQASQALVF